MFVSPSEKEDPSSEVCKFRPEVDQVLYSHHLARFSMDETNDLYSGLLNCNTLQRAAMCCNALQCVATRCNALQRAATRCNAL